MSVSNSGQLTARARCIPDGTYFIATLHAILMTLIPFCANSTIILHLQSKCSQLMNTYFLGR